MKLHLAGLAQVKERIVQDSRATGEACLHCSLVVLSLQRPAPENDFLHGFGELNLLDDHLLGDSCHVA